MKRKLPLYNFTNPCTKICSMPFKEMDIKPNGDAFCCDWITAPFGNLQLHSVHDVWNSDTAQEIRASIVDKSYRFCKGDQCPWLNSPNEKLNPFVDEIPVTPKYPEIINAAYDLTCNLSCGSCRMFLTVDQNFQRHEVLKNRILQTEGLKELILIGGGDPFSSPHTREWMNEGISIPDKITIWSNGILLTKKRWEALNENTRTRIKSIEISIDAAEPFTYHVIRGGGDWDILMENLRFVSSLRKENIIDNFRINFVVQAGNYKEMVPFVKLGESLGVDDIYFSRLEDWGSMSCNQIPILQVHLKTHRLHEDFLKELESPELQSPIVRLGNLRGRSQDAAC